MLLLTPRLLLVVFLAAHSAVGYPESTDAEKRNQFLLINTCE
jgi:hypothetical protein